ncbi:MAG: LacI family DNA-binding transcriptional regulator, partial [Deltaproteobacteria bacterium]|nr:LacI family DNA-binding transcriptional regulator [Deltaproteobacteria bacterium]
MPRRTTMHDIAHRAGVSPATVSRTIHSPHLVRPETRERVRRIMEASGYVYDAVAGEMSRKKTSVIGLIIPTVKSSIFARSTHGIQEKAQAEGFSVIIGNTNYKPQTEADLLRLFQERRVAGLILTGIAPGMKRLVQDLPERGTPCVVTWETFNNEAINYVGFDNFKAAYLATQHLLSLKHRRVGLICGPFSKVERVGQRLNGYRAALQDHGLEYDPELVIEKDYTLIEGKEAMQRLLALRPRPTAVFAASDVLAMGALTAARESGLRVPEDISLVGFDDID